MPAVYPNYRALKTAAPVVAAGTPTVVLTADTSSSTMLSYFMSVAVAALTGFEIQARVHPDAAWVTLFSTGAQFSNPEGDLIAASGDLTTLGSGSTGWFEMIVSGWESIRVLATSGGTAQVTGYMCLK